MPDWQELVRQRLSGLALDPAERDEVHAELAAHLEEAYESMLTDGINNSKAAIGRLTLPRIGKFCSGKSPSSQRRGHHENRVTQLWLPGLATFLLSQGILAVLQIWGPQAWILAKEGGLSIAVLYFWWLMLLPLVGASGAYLSWRAGGSQRAILLSMVFPVLPLLASILVVLPVSLVLDRFIAHNIAPMSLVFALFGWVLAPAATLLAGGSITQHFLSRRSGLDGVASR